MLVRARAPHAHRRVRALTLRRAALAPASARPALLQRRFSNKRHAAQILGALERGKHQAEHQLKLNPSRLFLGTHAEPMRTRAS